MSSSASEGDVEETEVPLLPVGQAICELVEYLYLKGCYARPQHHHLDGLKVRIKDDGSDTPGTHQWFSIKVTVPQMLSDQPEWMENISSGYIKSTVVLVMKMEQLFDACHLSYQHSQPGHDTVTYNVTLGCDDEPPDIEKKTKKYSGKVPVTAIFLRVYQAQENMVSECQVVYGFMHKLKLLSPETSFYFSLRIGGLVSSSDFGAYSYRQTVGKRKLAVGLKHYMRQDAVDECEELGLTKIKPRSSSAVTLVQCTSQGKRLGPYKFTVIAAITPPPPGDIVINHCCDKLNILFYGPHGVPLMSGSRSCNDVHVASVLRLSDYELQIQEQETATAESGVVHQDIVYSLRGTGDVIDAAEREDRGQHAIQLFIIMDTVKGHCTTYSAVSDCLSALRSHLGYLILHHSSKIRRAVTSALNKLLTNYSDKSHRQSQVAQAITTITKSVGGIVLHSTNQDFRERCFSLMKARTTSDMKESLECGLWKIAQQKFQVQSPLTSFERTQHFQKEPNQQERILSEKPDLENCSRVPSDMNKQQSYTQATTQNQSVNTCQSYQPLVQKEKFIPQNSFLGTELALSQSKASLSQPEPLASSSYDSTCWSRLYNTLPEAGDWDTLGQECFKSPPRKLQRNDFCELEDLERSMKMLSPSAPILPDENDENTDWLTELEWGDELPKENY